MNSTIRLSENFYLSEFVTSQIAERFGYNNEPNENHINNLKLLCINVLQPLRNKLRLPIFINSGYRSFNVNAAVGGRYNSQHMEGKAADITIPDLSLTEVFEILKTDFQFDQLIFEFGNQPRLDGRVEAGWIHVSWDGDNNRNDVMISKKLYGKTVYEKVKRET